MALPALIVVCVVALPQHADASHERLQATATPASPAPVPFGGRIDTIAHGTKLALLPPPFPLPRLNRSFKTGVPPLIAPGAVIRAYPLAVLRGNRIHAVVNFHLERGPPYPRITLRTPIIRLLLTSGRAPTVTVHSFPPVSAVVHPTTSRQRGELYHVGWYACRLANGQFQFGGSGFYEGPPGPQGIPPYLVGYLYFWAPSQTRVLQSGCSSPAEWHVVAGWLNQPVARVDYVTVPDRG